jgi:hypothetical protein
MGGNASRRPDSDPVLEDEDMEGAGAMRDWLGKELLIDGDGEDAPPNPPPPEAGMLPPHI